jgi:hypothetical protein
MGHLRVASEKIVALNAKYLEQFRGACKPNIHFFFSEWRALAREEVTGTTVFGTKK